MNRNIIAVLAVAATSFATSAFAQLELGTSFTHQGSLRDEGAPANGLYDFRFNLFNAQSGGNTVASSVSLSDVSVTDGVYGVTLDFGDTFDGNRRFLQVEVKRADVGSLTILSPRQEITPVPYALYSLTSGSSESTTDIVSESVRIGESTTNVGVGLGNYNGPNGDLNVRLGDESRDRNHGTVSVHNFDGDIRAEMSSIDDADIGFVRLFGDNGSDNVILSTTNGDDNDGRVTLVDEDNDEIVILVSVENEGGRLILRDDNGNTAADIQTDATNGGRMDIVSPDGDSVVDMRYVNDSDNANDGGGVFLRTPGGDDAGDFRSFQGFGGRFVIRSASGNLNVAAEGTADDNDHGFLAVFDSNGDSEAGILVNTSGQGVVFGDGFLETKQSKTKANSHFMYAALTGNESALYSRGKVTLENGSGLINLEESFSEFANLDTMTVHLTPYSGKSGGVGVESISANSIEIVDLLGSNTSYEVGYLLIADRNDSPEFQKVVTTKDGGSPFDNGTKNRLSTKANEDVYTPFEGAATK